MKPKAIEPLTALSQRLRQLPEWSAVSIQKAVDETLDEFELKLGKLAQPLRVALTGSSASPSIDVTIFFIGRERVLIRIDNALSFIGALVQGN